MSDADDPDEIAALERRHDEIRSRLEDDGRAEVADAFLQALAESKAVIARPLTDLERLSGSEFELLGTYYRQIDAGTRVPDSSIWDRRRSIAETSVFPGYMKDINFASLALDERGLPNYGTCFFMLRTTMIAHRTSVFEDNNVLVIERRNPAYRELVDPPKGFRATWDNRGKLCLAKLGRELQANMTEEDFPGLIQRPGATSADDSCIEVHVFGPISIHTVEKVVLTKVDRSPTAHLLLENWRMKLADLDVELTWT